MVAENKPGGGSVVGADLVAKSPPDGHTLLAAAAIGVIPALLPKLPFVPYKDLQPITLVGTVPFMMLVHPSVPEMVERLRAMGMQPIGSTPEEAETFIRAETAKWGAVIKASGAKAE